MKKISKKFKIQNSAPPIAEALCSEEKKGIGTNGSTGWGRVQWSRSSSIQDSREAMEPVYPYTALALSSPGKFVQPWGDDCTLHCTLLYAA